MKPKQKQVLIWTLKKIPLVCFIAVASLSLDYVIGKATIEFVDFMRDPAHQFVVADINVASASEQEVEPIIYVLTEVQKAGLDIKKVERLIGDCENKQWNTNASFINYDNRNGIDRGLWMINDKFHPEVSNACAYDLKCSTKEAIRILKKNGFKHWTCGRILGL